MAFGDVVVLANTRAHYISMDESDQEAVYRILVLELYATFDVLTPRS